MLWINLWIKGVKSVDKLVDKNVDNFWLWISPDLSTFLPQEFAAYPRFCPQLIRRVSCIGKRICGLIHTIHRPYYYYYSKNLMVLNNNSRGRRTRDESGL
jgi:hypothetical protein